MSERFKYYFPSQIIKDKKTGQRYYGNKPLAKLLNELYEDNQMLNRLVEKRDGWNNLAHEKIFELEEENESLKDVNAQCCNDYSAMRRDVLRYKKENEQLKKVLGGILLEVKRDISNTNQTGEIRVFINPDSFNLISEVLQKYGALKEWYE